MKNKKRILRQKQAEENNKKTKLLKTYLKNLGYSYIKLHGGWKENGVVTHENSFLVPNIDKETAIKLGNIFKQYGIILKEKENEKGQLIISIDDSYGDVDKEFDFSNKRKPFKEYKKIDKDSMKEYTGYSGTKKNGKGYNISFIDEKSD